MAVREGKDGSKGGQGWQSGKVRMTVKERRDDS